MGRILFNGRKALEFNGLEEIETPNAAGVDSLDSYDKLSYGAILKPGINITCALAVKGNKADPKNPTTGSFYWESINGFLYTYLFGSDVSGKDTLVYKSVNPVFNTALVKYLMWTWDFDNKQFILYEDGISIPIELVTSESNYHIDPNNMTLLTETNDVNPIFGYASGTNGFDGILLDLEYYPYKRSDVEINAYKDIYGYTGPQQTSLYEIAFTSDRTAQNQIHKCNENGQDQNLLLSSGFNDNYPIWNSAGNRLTFDRFEGGNHRAYTSTDTGGDVISLGISSDFTPSLGGANMRRASWSDDDQTIYVDGNSADLIAQIVIGTPPYLPNKPFTATQLYNSTVPDDYAFINPIDNNELISCRNPLSLFGAAPPCAIVSINLSTTLANPIITFQHGPGTSDVSRVEKARFSWDSTKIAFNLKEPVDTNHNLCICDADGSNFSKLTAFPFDVKFQAWFPDNSKMLVSTNEFGNWQLGYIPVGGGAITYISKNNFNDTDADIKIL